ncbi:MAG: hypothetical protein ACKO9Q_25200, partial [Pirellula sp.]
PLPSVTMKHRQRLTVQKRRSSKETLKQILGQGGRLGDSRDLIVLPEGPETIAPPTQLLGVP